MGRTVALYNFYFQELAGTKSLSVLAKKVPIFNRRDEIVRALCEFEVPVNRGVWLVKMTAAYAAAMQVNKNQYILCIKIVFGWLSERL